MSFIVDNPDGKLYTAYKVRNKSTDQFTCWGDYNWTERENGKLYQTLNGARRAIIANAAKREDYEIVQVTILESHEISKVHPYSTKTESDLETSECDS